MPRRLKEMDIAEISLVDKTANRRKFFIKKQDRRKIMDLLEILKSFFGEDSLSDEEIKKAELLPEDRTEKIGETLETLQKYEINDQESFPEDFTGAIKTLVKYATVSPLVEKSDEEPELDADIIIEKAGASLSKATKAQLEKIVSICQGLLKTKEDKAKAEGTDKLSADVIEKLDKLEKLETEKREAAEKAVKDKEDARDSEIEDLKKKVEELEKTKGKKKQLEDEGDVEDGDVEKKATQKWSSLDKMITTEEK